MPGANALVVTMRASGVGEVAAYGGKDALPDGVFRVGSELLYQGHQTAERAGRLLPDLAQIRDCVVVDIQQEDIKFDVNGD